MRTHCYHDHVDDDDDDDKVRIQTVEGPAQSAVVSAARPDAKHLPCKLRHHWSSSLVTL